MSARPDLYRASRSALAPRAVARVIGISRHVRGSSMRLRASARLGAAMLLALCVTAVACAPTVPGPRGLDGATSMVADSATIALWRMDEPGGDRVADEGPARLTAFAGLDTRTDFGRVQGARVFTRSVESFLVVPYNVALETASALTVEAWIRPASYGTEELTPIAARWTPLANEQSWLFGIVGRRFVTTGSTAIGPGLLLPLVQLGNARHLVFAIQPADASLPLSYFSSAEIDLDRWTHVAVTFDGQEVRFFVNGRLDSQYALGARIRPSRAPLLIGNFFDPRTLSDFGDRLRASNAADRTPHYAYEGAIDELRISRVARERFEVR